jgi:hypothetical protein
MGQLFLLDSVNYLTAHDIALIESNVRLMDADLAVCVNSFRYQGDLDQLAKTRIMSSDAVSIAIDPFHRRFAIAFSSYSRLDSSQQAVVYSRGVALFSKGDWVGGITSVARNTQLFLKSSSVEDKGFLASIDILNKSPSIQNTMTALLFVPFMLGIALAVTVWLRHLDRKDQERKRQEEEEKAYSNRPRGNRIQL